MTRDKANEVLYLWKVGAEIYPPHVITEALYVTGDLIGPVTTLGRRPLLTLGPRSGMEGLRQASSFGDATGVPVYVREIARVGAGRSGEGQ